MDEEEFEITSVECLKLEMDENLMSLGIGKNGCNVLSASKIEGVCNVEIAHSTDAFIITAYNKDAIQEARKILEYKKEVMMIPHHLVHKVIGKKGKTIRKIRRESKAIVKIENSDNHLYCRNPQNNGQVSVTIIGNTEKLAIARTLVENMIK